MHCQGKTAFETVKSLIDAGNLQIQYSFSLINICKEQKRKKNVHGLCMKKISPNFNEFTDSRFVEREEI
jgi:hypothetical protein